MNGEDTEVGPFRGVEAADDMLGSKVGDVPNMSKKPTTYATNAVRAMSIF